MIIYKKINLKIEELTTEEIVKKLSDGHIFGTNITDNEREKFAKDTTPNLEEFI